MKKDGRALQEIYERTFSGLDWAIDAMIGLLMRIETYEDIAMERKAIASDSQIAPRTEDLSVSLCNNLDGKGLMN